MLWMVVEEKDGWGEVKMEGSDEGDGYQRIRHTRGGRGERVSGPAEIEGGDGWRGERKIERAGGGESV